MADAIGYGSRYLIENSGSITIFIFLLILKQLLYWLFDKYLAPSRRLAQFAHGKRTDFYWAGCVEFIEEMYLTMSFAFAINMSSMDFVSAAVGFNNVFTCLIGASILVTPITLTRKLHMGWKFNQEEIEKEE